MDPNSPKITLSAPVALEVAKIKMLLESLTTIEANQRAIMYGQAAILSEMSGKPSQEWRDVFSKRVSIEIDSVNREHEKSLSELVPTLEDLVRRTSGP